MSMEKIVINTIDEMFDENRDLYKACKKIRNDYLDNKWPILNEFISQKDRGNFDLYDAYMLGDLLGYIGQGKALISIISVDSIPHPDKDIDGNNKILQTIHPPFEAAFIPDCGGGGPHDDGYLSWNDTIYLTQNKWGQAFTEIALPPSNEYVSLEVGTFQSYKWFWWKNRAHGLARWPYGHDYITFVYFTDDLKKDEANKFCDFKKPIKDKKGTKEITNKQLDFFDMLLG